MTHEHDHAHDHGHDNDIAAFGDGHFDARAATWDDDPAKVERSRQVADALRAAVPLGPSTRLLEYGAGTGLLTQALGDSIGPATLADPSTGMRDVMTEKVASGALPPATRVWDLDLTRDPVPAERFDLVATVMTLHHIPDLGPVLRGFAELLDDDGRLAIVDLDAEDGSFHGEGFGGHQGFDHDELTRQLEAAGFTDVTFRPCFRIERGDGSYPLFLATASRPARS